MRQRECIYHDILAWIGEKRPPTHEIRGLENRNFPLTHELFLRMPSTSLYRYLPPRMSVPLRMSTIGKWSSWVIYLIWSVFFPIFMLVYIVYSRNNSVSSFYYGNFVLNLGLKHNFEKSNPQFLVIFFTKVIVLKISLLKYSFLILNSGTNN